MKRGKYAKTFTKIRDSAIFHFATNSVKRFTQMYDRDLWDAMLDMTDWLGTNMATGNQKIETDNETLRKICPRLA